jgi:hypothetical protein
MRFRNRRGGLWEGRKVQVHAGQRNVVRDEQASEREIVQLVRASVQAEFFQSVVGSQRHNERREEVIGQDP